MDERETNAEPRAGSPPQPAGRDVPTRAVAIVFGADVIDGKRPDDLGRPCMGRDFLARPTAVLTARSTHPEPRSSDQTNGLRAT